MLQTSHYVNHPLHPIDLLKIVYAPIDQFWFLYTLFAMMVVYRIFLKISGSRVAFLCLAIVCFFLEASNMNITHWIVAHGVASYL